MNPIDFQSLAAKWPSEFVAREKVAEFSGGILHPRTMANLDALGKGPRRFRVGGKVAYFVKDLCNWLASRSQELG